MHYVLYHEVYDIYKLCQSCSILPYVLRKEHCDNWVHDIYNIAHLVFFSELIIWVL